MTTVKPDGCDAPWMNPTGPSILIFSTLPCVTGPLPNGVALPGLPPMVGSAPSAAAAVASGSFAAGVTGAGAAGAGVAFAATAVAVSAGGAAAAGAGAGFRSATRQRMLAIPIAPPTIARFLVIANRGLAGASSRSIGSSISPRTTLRPAACRPPPGAGAVVRRTGISTSSAAPLRFALARAASRAIVVLARLAHFSRAGVTFAMLRANPLFSFFDSSSCSSSGRAVAFATMPREGCSSSWEASISCWCGASFMSSISSSIE